MENPQWKELREKLEKLQQQRKKLLETLTASHPSVVAVDMDITDVEQQLQSVPAQILADGQQPEQVATPAVEKAAVASTPESQQEAELPPAKQPAMVPAPTIDLAAWASRWSTEDSQFHDLAKQLTAAKERYRSALEQEEAARQKHAEAAAAVAAFDLPPAPEPATAPAPAAAPTFEIAPEPVAEPSAARPWRTIPWCGLVAVVLGLIVASKAVISEPVFRAAAAVRQALELPVLGILSRGPSQVPREQPQREPRWVRRTVLSAELWLLAIVVLLAATAWLDQQFWRDLIANPLAACSKKFFC